MGLGIDRQGSLYIITFRRPEALNALDVETMRELREAWLEFRDDSRYRVAIVTGEGERAFCTGADLKKTLPPTASFAQSYFEPYEDSVDHGLYLRALAMEDLEIRKPLIAAINGHAVAGGLEIALNCDIRVASTNASLGLPEPQVGSIPAFGGLARLLQAVPTAVAMRMLLTGDPINAAEALRVGLVSDVVEAPDLMPLAIRLAERIAANGPLAVGAVKTLAMAQQPPLGQRGAVALEQLMWGVLRDTADRIEGRRAFAEKRKPSYEGR